MGAASTWGDWLWSPFGAAGTTPVVELASVLERSTAVRGPARALHRADLDLAGQPVSVDWRGLALVATVEGTGLVSAVVEPGRGEQTVVWPYHLMPSAVLGHDVTMEREALPTRRGVLRRGVQRLRGATPPWQWRVSGPDGRAWTWRAAGGPVLADRMELRRDGQDEPVVTHLLRPVPGRPGADRRPEQAEVSWTGAACPAEVLLDVLWVLDGGFEGILPKAQRVLRADVL